MTASSWLTIDADSPFSLANIPFGIFSKTHGAKKGAGTAVGKYVIDLAALAAHGVFDTDVTLGQASKAVFGQDTLNAFAALGQEVHEKFRVFLKDLLAEDTSRPELLRDNERLRAEAVKLQADVVMHLPLAIGDYTDFYAGINHAYNVGCLFRGPENALQPNYLHLPVGYHGRASSIQISGYPVRRPCGQILSAPGAKTPIFSPCKKLDIELELAAFVCKPNEQGHPVSIENAHEHIFGYVLMNDWSARDVQAWEYVPLGPFNAKNFATTISPWVVLQGALEPFRTNLDLAPGSEKLLPYLRQQGPKPGFDIPLEVELVVEGHRTRVSTSNSTNLCFSFEQMLTHHSVTGCNLRVGDLLGSGTISGKEPNTLGSFLEMTGNGKSPVKLGSGSQRTFLEDGDEVILSGAAGQRGGKVGFGECRGVILKAHDFPRTYFEG